MANDPRREGGRNPKTTGAPERDRPETERQGQPGREAERERGGSEQQSGKPRTPGTNRETGEEGGGSVSPGRKGPGKQERESSDF